MVKREVVQEQNLEATWLQTPPWHHNINKAEAIQDMRKKALQNVKMNVYKMTTTLQYIYEELLQASRMGCNYDTMTSMYHVFQKY